MLVGAPLMEAEQDSSIRIEDLAEVVMGRKGSSLTEQRLVPFDAARHVAHPYDRPRALHWAPLRPDSGLDRPHTTATDGLNEVYTRAVAYPKTCCTVLCEQAGQANPTI